MSRASRWAGQVVDMECARKDASSYRRKANTLKNATQKGLAAASSLCASAYCLAKRVARVRISRRDSGMAGKLSIQQRQNLPWFQFHLYAVTSRPHA
jgi:hypothetical protein